MALFKCEKCGCVENTALSGQGFQRTHLYDWSYAPELKGKMLCSECGPRKFKDGKPTPCAGKWHDVFKKERYKESHLDPEVLNKLRDVCMINLAQNGARIAIVISDNPKHLKKKFRTWVKLYPNDLNRNIKTGPNSKFVFVVKHINELPIMAGYQARVILFIHKLTGIVRVLKANTSDTLIFKASENLEHYLNDYSSKGLSEYYLFKPHTLLKLTPKDYHIHNNCIETI